MQADMRSLACQLRHHVCCLLAQDSKDQGGRPQQLHPQKQLQSFHGSLADLPSHAVVSLVAARRGPQLQQLVADLTEAMLEVCDAVEDALRVSPTHPQCHGAASSSPAAEVPPTVAEKLHQRSRAIGTELPQGASGQAECLAWAMRGGRSISSAQAGQHDGQAGVGNHKQCKTGADGNGGRPPVAPAPASTEMAEPHVGTQVRPWPC